MTRTPEPGTEPHQCAHRPDELNPLRCPNWPACVGLIAPQTPYELVFDRELTDAEIERFKGRWREASQSRRVHLVPLGPLPQRVQRPAWAPLISIIIGAVAVLLALALLAWAAAR